MNTYVSAKVSFENKTHKKGHILCLASALKKFDSNARHFRNEKYKK